MKEEQQTKGAVILDIDDPAFARIDDPGQIIHP